MLNIALLTLVVAGRAAQAQDFITRGANTDPAWARIISAAQHVTAAETDYWAALSVVDGFPITVNLGNV